MVLYFAVQSTTRDCERHRPEILWRLWGISIFFKSSWWCNWAVRSRLRPILEVARKLKRRLENIITYLRHRITNAASESINAKVQWVKYTARGFRNKQNFIHTIYFHCGALDMAQIRYQLNSRKRPTMRQANNIRHTSQRMENCVMGMNRRKFTREFKETAIRRFGVGGIGDRSGPRR